MKADLAHAISSIPFIAVPGVTSALKALEKIIPLLKSVGVKKILLAYDMDRVLNINVLEGLHVMKSMINENGLEVEELTWSTNIVLLNGVHEQMDLSNTFVFTPDSLSVAFETNNKGDEKIHGLLERVKTLEISQILFALPNSKALTEETKSNYEKLEKITTKYSLKCKPVFWSLRLKGIDDYYAHKMRGVKYV